MTLGILVVSEYEHDRKDAGIANALQRAIDKLNCSSGGSEPNWRLLDPNSPSKSERGYSSSVYPGENTSGDYISTEPGYYSVERIGLVIVHINNDSKEGGRFFLGLHEDVPVILTTSGGDDGKTLDWASSMDLLRGDIRSAGQLSVDEKITLEARIEKRNVLYLTSAGTRAKNFEYWFDVWQTEFSGRPGALADTSEALANGDPAAASNVRRWGLEVLEKLTALDVLLQGFSIISDPDQELSQLREMAPEVMLAAKTARDVDKVLGDPARWFKECRPDIEDIFDDGAKGVDAALDRLKDALQTSAAERGPGTPDIDSLREAFSPSWEDSEGNKSPLMQICEAVRECVEYDPDTEKCEPKRECDPSALSVLSNLDLINKAHEQFKQAATSFFFESLFDKFECLRLHVSHDLCKNRFGLCVLGPDEFQRGLDNPRIWPLLQAKTAGLFALGSTLLGIDCDAVFEERRREVEETMRRIEAFRGKDVQQCWDDVVSAYDTLRDQLSGIPEVLRANRATFRPIEVHRALDDVTASGLAAKITGILEGQLAEHLLFLDDRDFADVSIEPRCASYWQLRVVLDKHVLTAETLSLLHPSRARAVIRPLDMATKLLPRLDAIAATGLEWDLTPEEREAQLWAHLKNRNAGSMQEFLERAMQAGE